MFGTVNSISIRKQTRKTILHINFLFLWLGEESTVFACIWKLYVVNVSLTILISYAKIKKKLKKEVYFLLRRSHNIFHAYPRVCHEICDAYERTVCAWYLQNRRRKAVSPPPIMAGTWAQLAPPYTCSRRMAENGDAMPKLSAVAACVRSFSCR